jgi:hypothetical protein
MPLRSFAVERYRGFLERTCIEVRPLTLIFGYNSAGKSALVRLLPMVRDTLRERRDPIWFGSPVLRQARFADLHSKLSPTPVIALELASDTVEARYEIRDLPDQRRQIVERVTMRRGNTTEILEWTSQGATYDHSVDGQRRGQREVIFEGLTPRRGDDEAEHLAWQVPGAEDLLSVQWIDAVRARVPRRMELGVRPHGPLASNGADAPAALAYAREDGSPVYETVRYFYREHLDHTIEATPTGDDFRVRIAPNKTPTLAVDLTDTGEGLSQVLPVVIALARGVHREGPTILAIEQPELHLHPALHEKLARWMCKLVAENTGPRLVLETHSENFLLSVLIALLEGEISTEHLVVYWVYQLEDGQSVAERVTFDELGRPQGAWPPHVFNEDAALATRLNTLRIGRLRT